MKAFWVAVSLLLLVDSAWADESFYCPSRHGYINLGMSVSEVLAACGNPQERQDSSDRPITQRVPVKQLIYPLLNTGSVYPTLDPIYDLWSLPSGTQGISLEVDIINHKVDAVRLNGSQSNAMSICNGVGIQIGDDEAKVYNACGSGGMVNYTYIDEAIPSQQKPEIWIYQFDPYQPPHSLTFVNGNLQSIN